jgi:hypothetical protein
MRRQRVAIFNQGPMKRRRSSSSASRSASPPPAAALSLGLDYTSASPSPPPPPAPESVQAKRDTELLTFESDAMFERRMAQVESKSSSTGGVLCPIIVRAMRNARQSGRKAVLAELEPFLDELPLLELDQAEVPAFAERFSSVESSLLQRGYKGRLCPKSGYYLYGVEGDPAKDTALPPFKDMQQQQPSSTEARPTDTNQEDSNKRKKIVHGLPPPPSSVNPQLLQKWNAIKFD